MRSWHCNKALHGVAEGLARATEQDRATVYQDLRAILPPNGRLVPAHAMLVVLCQERGCTYQALV